MQKNYPFKQQYEVYLKYDQEIIFLYAFHNDEFNEKKS